MGDADDTDEQPRTPRLYQKPNDYWEVLDVRGVYREVADRLEELLRQQIAQEC
jgi:hypothetical protein